MQDSTPCRQPGGPPTSTTAQAVADRTHRTPIEQLRRWSELVDFALDNEPERIDALLLLAEELEGVLDAARVADRPT